MRDSLPESIDPVQQATRSGPLAGVWPAERCKRLAAEGRRVLEDIALEASFVRHGTGQIDIDGRIRARMTLVCQRCLQPMAWAVDEAFYVAVYDERSESSGRTPERDAVGVDEAGRIATGRWLEDEVLLRMPLAPVHADIQDCDQRMVDQTREFDPDDTAEKGDNPFSVLKDYF